MNKMNKIAASAMVALSVTAVAATASASPTNSPVCEGRNARSQASGNIIGRVIVDQAWAAVGENPDEVDAFRTALKQSVLRLVKDTLRSGASDFVKCRAQGLLDGVKQRLTEIQIEVFLVCLVDGGFWGELMAELYCDLAQEFGGLEFLDLEFPELQEATCGFGFEIGCFAQYSVTSADLCPAFTIAPHTEAYSENKRNACTYLF